MSDPLILIPARLAATRLPSKPLADIAGVPMIVHVWRRAVEAGIGPVVVATDTDAVAEVIEAQGGLAVMTRPDHPSGSDRLAEALEIVDPDGNHDVVVNVQGDLPTIDPAIIAASVMPLADPQVDIATLCAVIHRPEEMDDPNVVKIIGHTVGPNRLRALAFTRARAPWGDGLLFHHIGLYAYRRKALARFVALPQGELEQREKLEQLRALEAGMRIDAMIVEDLPLGVDTPADLERARTLLAIRRLN
ncbi:3-deoxy-manno-octulosonate cytidylyltransferase [Methylorubrum extorquens]|uniref:3-deoxy-manno-octulosonate cytidylyltransferase n=1 Tax=Methylorubrum extorquens TaxID=408 RepID=UPI002237E1FD|nr:3-deoxy-manno-octulosonate cytidylyltransferase [Methylorubrum extorquens]UYW26593.1 3-deoxy-manno-octulosonate cytidylyltransferase [Methylorubrum extorquens]UYW33532.1 3-deoxy-manno-octulosonate cytidylyltransferase [Methylorubrum extorquens]